MSKLALIRQWQSNGGARGGEEGDPFIGAIAGLAGPLIKKLGGGILGKVGGLFGKKAAARQIAGPAGGSRLGGIVRAGTGLVAGGAAFEAGSRLVRKKDGTMVLRRRRRRGISHTELRGFRKITSLLRSVGMVPKGLRGRRKAVCR
jgi:hypothetical protein